MDEGQIDKIEPTDTAPQNSVDREENTEEYTDSSELIPDEEEFKIAVTGDKRTVLSGMFRDWYLEYASYVILERAVPHIEDGLKPVQRRILHSMQTLDDGRFNKVANIVGNTMQYHPHGDASIGDALVQLGQKDLLIDTQGNWGNILTGDEAAAPRYIEARLSEFALETVFNPKITEWTLSYDGRKREPVTLPVKFPLLLAQGVEGIAVGLSSKILPHNFNEIIDAAIAYLNNESFTLLPDFQTGGLMDVSRYNDGARGGAVKVRAKIEKLDNKTLVITELPFGKNTSTLISSILSAMEKGKIKIRHVDNNTSANAEIVVHLIPGTSSDKAIDALYAFTDCEVSISPNCCVVRDKKPRFMSVSELLRFSVDHTMELLRQELEIRLAESREARLLLSLEKIFIEERMYKDRQVEQSSDMDAAVDRVDELLEPFKPSFFREIIREDLLKLWEIKMARILAFNASKAEERIAALEAEIEQLEYDLNHIVEYTVKWFKHLKDKYGARYPRRTVIRGFDSIEASKVAEANKRFYFDKEGGFVGTALKDKKFLFTCSDLDDVIIFYKTGTYKIVRVQEKLYVGKKILHIGLFKKNDERTIYNVIYRNGKDGYYYKKRFFITGLTRDKEYDMTKGLPGSKIEWFTANSNGEAEVVKVMLKDEPLPGGRRPRISEVIVDFSELAVKGKEALGNLVTKYPVSSVTLLEKGKSTLGGREVWFDCDVLRLNYDGRGESLGLFQGEDKILVLTRDGEFFTTGYSDEIHFDDNIFRIEKFDPSKVWTLVLFDASQGFPYIKRFGFEISAKPQRYVGNEPESKLLLLTDTVYPRLEVVFGGVDEVRPPMIFEADEFIGVKSFKAKGKRLTTYQMASVEELEPTRIPEAEPEVEVEIVEDVNDTEDGPQIVQGDLFENVSD
ncbi:MAG: DNA gyrase/topoisomerase IV subunit A [Prevotella sp.]|nr:DNA gyrase/topoisomerase IV subunit A [Bacteroides sp.]MCM1366299.1 DNA gyrase/topoisomerase IV subunit A [Prevotella sp.]MCM1437103.1 DNA gyrase/topoisomerase IV subunit A [Prevotella sp.]